MIKDIIKKVLFFPGRIYNLINFKIHGVTYEKGLSTIGRIGIYRGGKLTLGKNVTINSSRYANPLGDKMVFEIKRGAEVVIGNNSGLSCSIIKADTCVRIDEYVNVGAGCMIMDTDSHALNEEARKSNEKNEMQTVSKPIHIKSGAFIGARSIILKGVTIGEGSVVGAGSVVTKNIPSGEIWAGNPARYIKKIVRSDDNS